MKDGQTAALVRRIEQEQREGASGRRGYSVALRRDILAHVATETVRGRPRADVARELGISVVSVDRWKAKGESAPFRELEVVADAMVTATSGGAVVRLPDGTVVEGLSVAEVVALLRGLR